MNMLEPESDTEKLEEYFGVRTWVPLSDQYPITSRRVFVRFATGTVQGGEWHAETGSWMHSNFSFWGQPVAWAAFPGLCAEVRASPRRQLEGLLQREVALLPR